MRRWDVFMVELPAPLGWHPVVVISPQRVIDEGGIPSVNALLCSTIRGSDRVGSREVYLDQADDFDAPTGCQCHAMLLIPKRKFLPEQRKGEVSTNRRDLIIRKLREIFELI